MRGGRESNRRGRNVPGLAVAEPELAGRGRLERLSPPGGRCPGVSRDPRARAGVPLGGEAPSCSCASGGAGPGSRRGSARGSAAASAGRGMDGHYYGGEQSGSGAGRWTCRGGRRARQSARGRGAQRRGPGLRQRAALVAPIAAVWAVQRRCPLGAGGFVRPRGCPGGLVRTAPLPCPVRAGARPVPRRFL